jgi:hypothetical protein
MEAVGLLLLALYLFSLTGFSWWLYALLFLAPDISMIGYLVNSQVGARSYNLFHHQGLAALLYLAGLLMLVPVLQLIGSVLLGHSAMDRLFGFGLKYPDSFYHTHLGFINEKDN